MKLFRSEDVKEHIINILLDGAPKTGTQILGEITKSFTVSKQGMYKSLGVLLQEEVIVKQRTQFILNNLWKDRLSARLHNQFSSKLLEDGDSMSFTFSDAAETDRLWAHYFLEMFNQTTGPVFLYNHHEWFVVAHAESEESMFEQFIKHNRKLCITIVGETPHDVLFAKQYRSSNVAINTGIAYDFPNYLYVNVFGDYVLEAYFTVGFSEDLEAIYQQDIPQLLFKESITNLVNSKRKVKLKISHDVQKAQVYRKKLSKEFIL